MTRRGEGIGITFDEWANAVLNNGLAHFGKTRPRVDLAPPICWAPAAGP
ncbi:hypothetical protein [Nocardia sp. NBC_01329]|nr:hypothetical protein OG405_14655 [Nocardia sp. NBC_01329]